MLNKMLKLALLPILHTVATYLLTCKHMYPLSQTSSLSPHYLPCRIKIKRPFTVWYCLLRLASSTYLIFTPTSYAPTVLYFWFLEHCVLSCLCTPAMLFSLYGMLLPVFFSKKLCLKASLFVDSSLNS